MYFIINIEYMDVLCTHLSRLSSKLLIINELETMKLSISILCPFRPIHLKANSKMFKVYYGTKVHINILFCSEYFKDK